MLFADFVRQYQDMVYTTAIRITGDTRDAQDISQEVFIKAHAAFGNLGDHENPGGWLRSTARNLGINHVLRYQRRFVFPWGRSSEGLPLERIAEENEDTSWLFDTSDLLKRSLLKLPHAFRAPLVLHYYEGLEYQEIATRLGVSLSKVKTDIMRAKRELRRRISTLEQSNG